MVLQIPLSASFCLFKGIKTSSSTSATEILLFKTIRQRFQKTDRDFTILAFGMVK